MWVSQGSKGSVQIRCGLAHLRHLTTRTYHQRLFVQTKTRDGPSDAHSGPVTRGDDASGNTGTDETLGEWRPVSRIRHVASGGRIGSRQAWSRRRTRGVAPRWEAW